ncbi:agmatine deiminase [Spiroplasma endosymbiont of Ammophila pubescens]|uniref:agmatine deiminase n=1 Tax=Spiroplasma endosymbiont of Ammophila pubescens TaxID=3066315 RepID=UPI0032B2D7D6
MSKLLTTTPQEDGFYLSAEASNHLQTWMIWPYMKDNWQKNAFPAQKIFALVAKIISNYEPVQMIVNEQNYLRVKKMLRNSNINLVKTNYYDSWACDIGALYLINEKGERRAVSFEFNDLGIQNSLMLKAKHFNWDYNVDNNVAITMANTSGVDYYACSLVLESGSIHVDGEGTLYITEECLLNPNRNPTLTKLEIEQYLKQYLNVKKIIWITRGLYNDEACGHINNLLQIVEPGHVLLAWTDNKDDPQYERSIEALSLLESTTDAKERKLKITKIYQPLPLFLTQREATDRECSLRFKHRMPGFRLPASYLNFHFVNKAMICPIFGDPVYDQKAILVLRKCFSKRKVIPVYAREIILGGGGINSMTQSKF